MVYVAASFLSSDSKSNAVTSDFYLAGVGYGMLSLRSTVTLATYSRFFFLPLPPFPRFRLALSVSLALHRIPLLSLSPTSGPRLGGAARPPAASLSPLHIAAPHAYPFLLARGAAGPPRRRRIELWPASSRWRRATRSSMAASSSSPLRRRPAPARRLALLFV